MTYPDDVLKAAREAAARYWGELHLAEPGVWDGFAESALKGEFDGDAEVRAACIAIMAERERCARIASRMEVGGIVETPELIPAILGQRERVTNG